MKRVDTCEVERKHDHWTIIDKNGKETPVYDDDYNVMVDILKNINETLYKECLIPATVIGERLCDAFHPEMKTKMFRPTGAYAKFYYNVLKILDHNGYIEYYKTGDILKLQKFKDITQIKRGWDVWF